MEIAEILKIVKENPNKHIVKFGVDINDRLEKCILGENLNDFFKRNDYFENEQIHKERKKTISNKDLFSMVLQKEMMVFNARGGSVLYDGITPAEQAKLNGYLDNVRNGINMRTWIQSYANKAYEVDPMGVIFIEKSDNGDAYPTYKSVKTVYDYKINGQHLDYVCFHLSDCEKDALEEKYNWEDNDAAKYYRFVDEIADYIVEVANNQITIIDEFTIKHGFESCPAFVVSDVPYFKDINCRLSKLDNVIELAEQYQEDRSVRDLSKKYHGFPKLVEPLVKCDKCVDGYIGKNICHHCDGTGRKKISKVSDSIKLPLEMLAENASLDISKIFMYITPDIETWNKQDNSLSDLENQISDCFWGTDNRKYTSGANLQSNLQETATKTMTNLQPVYSRLERTAEWAEQLEAKLVYYIGKLKYNSLKSVSIQYGRNYILESTDEIYKQYLDYKKENSPQYILNDYLDRYLRSLYQNNPVELSMALKMMEVEPFIHYTVDECIKMGIIGEDLQQKQYFSQWYNSKTNDYLFATTAEKMKADLLEFSKQQQKESEQKESYAVKLGVGGTEALQAVLSDQVMTPIMKKNTLIVIFGLTEEEASMIIDFKQTV